MFLQNNPAIVHIASFSTLFVLFALMFKRQQFPVSSIGFLYCNFASKCYVIISGEFLSSWLVYISRSTHYWQCCDLFRRKYIFVGQKCLLNWNFRLMWLSEPPWSHFLYFVCWQVLLFKAKRTTGKNNIGGTQKSSTYGLECAHIGLGILDLRWFFSKWRSLYFFPKLVKDIVLILSAS